MLDSFNYLGQLFYVNSEPMSIFLNFLNHAKQHEIRQSPITYVHEMSGKYELDFGVHSIFYQSFENRFLGVLTRSKLDQIVLSCYQLVELALLHCNLSYHDYKLFALERVIH